MFKPTPLSSSLLITSLVLSPAGFAQASDEDTSSVLAPIIVTGLRPVADEDNTASVSILTAEDLAIRNSPLLADELRAVPGLGVSRSGAAGGLTQVRIRGAEANQTLVLVDGIEVSDPITGETDFGLWSGLDAERIEVLRGEQSALYGSEAIGGVINVITNKDSGLAAFAETGTQDSWRFDARGGIGSETGYLTVSTANTVTSGTDTSGLGGETDGSRHVSGTLRAGLSFGDNWALSALSRYSDANADFDEDTDFDGALNNTGAEVDTEQLTLGSTLAGDAFGLNHIARASYHRTERDTRNSGFDNITEGDRFELSYSPSAAFQAFGAEHTLSGLAEFEATDFERRGAPVLFGDPNQSQSFDTFGLAAEYRLKRDALDVNASIRFDENDGLFDDAVTWRAGAAYDVEILGGRLRGSVGEGVTNPTFTELFGFIPGTFNGNPELQPERSLSWEIGWDQNLGPVDVSLTYFSAELEDEIFTAFDANFFSTPQNRTADSDRQGVEFGARVNLTNQLSLAASASWIDSDDENGVSEIRVPDWTGSLSANWQNDTGWRLGIAVDLVGEQEDLNFGTFPASRVDLPVYALLSASAEIPISEHIALTLRGENLADSEAQDVFGFFRTGAAGFIGIKVR